MAAQYAQNITIHSLQEYLDWITKTGTILWFRGEAMDYGDSKLTPAVWRSGMPGHGFASGNGFTDTAPVLTDIEIDVIRGVQADWDSGKLDDPDFAARMGPHDDPDHIDWLFLAQHHGYPTRLLDVTSDPFMALYFAVSTHPSKNGIVWTGRHNFNAYPPSHYANNTLLDVFDIFTTADGYTPGPETPFLMKPLASNTKTVAQFGMFMWTRAPVEIESAPLPLYIDKAAKSSMKAAIEKWAPDPNRHLYLP